MSTKPFQERHLDGTVLTAAESDIDGHRAPLRLGSFLSSGIVTPVSPAAPLPVTTGLVTVSASFTRPSTASPPAFAKGDLVCSSTLIYCTLTLPAIGRYRALRAIFGSNNPGSPAGGDFRLRFFTSVPTTTATDNTLMTGTAGLSRTGYVGAMDVSFDPTDPFLNAMVGEGVAIAPTVDIPFTAAATSLYCVVAANNAGYATIASEVFDLTLHLEPIG